MKLSEPRDRDNLVANIELFQHLIAMQAGAKFALLLIVIAIRLWG